MWPITGNGIMSRFVTFEGIDGTGKSSVCKRVHEALVEERINLKTTREPSDSWLGGLVNESFDKDISPYSEALLFCADRAQHTREIRAWMREGHHVLCDRYVDSTVAYQGAVLDPHHEGDDLLGWLKALNDPYIIIPDLTVLLMADPEICLGRVGTRAGMSKFERLGTLRAVQENYERISKGDDRFVILDAEEPLDVVSDRALDIIRKLLSKD